MSKSSYVHQEGVFIVQNRLELLKQSQSWLLSNDCHHVNSPTHLREAFCAFQISSDFELPPSVTCFFSGAKLIGTSKNVFSTMATCSIHWHDRVSRTLHFSLLTLDNMALQQEFFRAFNAYI